MEDRKEYPMSGFRFICGDCGKIEGFMTGMDFSYRRTYRATRQKAEEGAFGEKLTAFLHDHPEAALNPENRVLKQVQIEDGRLASEVTSMLMGTDVGPRKDFIHDHANEAEIDS